MEKIRELIEYKDYGYIDISIDKLMEKKKVSAYLLSNKSNISYKTIRRLLSGGSVERIDLDTLAKLCYMFDCDICDFMTYVKPLCKKSDDI